MIERTMELDRLAGLLSQAPVVGIVGARQVGKTTLARRYLEISGESASYFDLEDPGDEARLADPMLALGALRGLVVLDEIQRVPEIFPVLRVLADRPGTPARFLILGSASPGLLRQSAESLAGRIFHHQLDGFCLGEVGSGQTERLWIRGGFPKSFTAPDEARSFQWRREFLATFLERDLPQLGIRVNATTMRRFWTMLAHYHGQIWNASEFARSFGVADTTVRGYLETLAASLVVRLLPPWHENLRKRQVKAPKIYIADSGLLHALLNLPEREDIESHPKLGASWEGFVIRQILHRLGAEPDEAYFWATHAGAELDLFVIRGRRRLGFEIKRTVSPKLTPSMRHALEDLKLDELCVVHAGPNTFPMAPKIRAVPASRILEEIEPL